MVFGRWKEVSGPSATLVEVAGTVVTGIGFHQGRAFGLASRSSMRASRMEVAAGWWAQRRGNLSFEGRKALVPVADAGDIGQQGLGVGVTRR